MSSNTHKLCVSLLPETAEQIDEWLPNCADSDLIEIRLDYLPEIDVAKLVKKAEKPLIITLRTRTEGGFWNGKAADYRAIIQNAANAGAAYLDVEWQLADSVLPLLKAGNSKVVLSHHTESNNPEELKEIFRSMTQHPADVYKLIFKAEDMEDNHTALMLTELATSLDKKFVIHAMGNAGRPSRLVGAVKGNEWTYLAKDYDEETASGQPALHEAHNYYHLQHKSTATKLMGLIGNPIQQSRGWRLHNQMIFNKFTQNKNAAEPNDFLYLNFPTEDVESFWQQWQSHLHGLSVTIPYKEQIVKFLNEVSVEVRISGVCNTIVRGPKGWCGYNTDLLAIESLLKPYTEALKNGGLVIGTGATARSTIAAMKRLDVNPIFVIGRNKERGEMLMQKYGIDYLEPDEIHYASAAVIVQTTPVGMAPYTDQYPSGTSLFRKKRVVMDVVYNPPETCFLKIARERGCITISGVEMFLLQATKQFELFTGTPVTVEELRAIWENIH
ncbi:MAG: type I 3-dehydroquinate dehydratase [Calditrichia bacterium]